MPRSRRGPPVEDDFDNDDILGGADLNDESGIEGLPNLDNSAAPANGAVPLRTHPAFPGGYAPQAAPTPRTAGTFKIDQAWPLMPQTPTTGAVEAYSGPADVYERVFNNQPAGSRGLKEPKNNHARAACAPSQCGTDMPDAIHRAMKCWINREQHHRNTTRKLRIFHMAYKPDVLIKLFLQDDGDASVRDWAQCKRALRASGGGGFGGAPIYFGGMDGGTGCPFPYGRGSDRPFSNEFEVEEYQDPRIAGLLEYGGPYASRSF